MPSNSGAKVIPLLSLHFSAFDQSAAIEEFASVPIRAIFSDIPDFF
jgi:hypothetical protein